MKSPVTSLRGNEKTEDIAITPALNPADFDDDVDEHKDVDHIHARELAAGYVEGSDAEKKLLTKLDFRLVVCFPSLEVSSFDISY